MFEACTTGNVQNLHTECGNIDRNFISNMMSSAMYDFIHFDIDEKNNDTLSKIKDIYDSITSDLKAKPRSFLRKYNMICNTNSDYVCVLQRSL